MRLSIDPESHTRAERFRLPWSRLRATGAVSLQRAALLRQMQRVILGLLVFGAVALYTPGTSPEIRVPYLVFLAALGLVTGSAMVVGASGRYRAAAWLTILAGISPAWSALLLNPEVLRGDYIPMAYAVLPMILAAILLGAAAVVGVAAVQALGFALLLSLAPSSEFNWPSLLSLIFVVTVLASVSGLTSQADLRAVEEANRRLGELQEVLHHESVRDPLTGLYNRRHLEAHLVREISRTRRQGSSLGFVLVDLDHFKEVNDQQGHAAGDAALVFVAGLLAKHSRASDIAFRLGGDEFLLVLADADLSGTCLRAERLRAEVQSASEDRSGPPITLSIGVATYPEHGADQDELLKAADLALYAAKGAGRNRVAVAVAPNVTR